MEVLAYPYWHGGSGPGWWIVFPILWFTIIATVVFVVARRWRPRPAAVSGQAILAERYARGDITEDEYRERLTVLKSDNKL